MTTTHKKDETPKMCAKKNTSTQTMTLLKVCMPYTKFYAILHNMSSQKINQHIASTQSSTLLKYAILRVIPFENYYHRKQMVEGATFFRYQHVRCIPDRKTHAL